MKDRSEVCLLSYEANFEPLSIPLQDGLRFFRFPLPADLSVGLATFLPRRETSGLPCSAHLPAWVRFHLYADGATSAVRMSLVRTLDRSPFGTGVLQQVSPVLTHDADDGSHMLTLPSNASPSTAFC